MRVNGVHYRTVWIEGSVVKMIDQRRLPGEFVIVSMPTYRETAEAIRDMTVRGAGAIGVAAGFGMAQAALSAPEGRLDTQLAEAAELLRATRPTAHNLFYAIDRILSGVALVDAASEKRTRAREIAQAIADEDAQAGERIGLLGQHLFGASTTILTHCNAGWLAFADWGTALAPVYRAHREGKQVHVYAGETRPRSQGAKLTAWELTQEGIACTLIPDTATGHLMRQGLIDLVLVGADRIAANGDVANKIGTYTLAVLARTHHLPFYVAAPTSTIDLDCPSGAAIPIEERAAEEVVWTSGLTAEGRPERVRIPPADVAVRNWAFDVTPAEYITGLLTERGLIHAQPDALRDVMRAAPAPI